MRNLLVIVLVASSLTYISAQSTGVQTQPSTFLGALLQSEVVQHKLNNAIDLVDLKIQYIRLLKTLFTTENLILLRRTLEWANSISNFIIRFLPENPNQPSLFSIVRGLFPIVNQIDSAVEEYEVEASPSGNVFKLADRFGAPVEGSENSDGDSGSLPVVTQSPESSGFESGSTISTPVTSGNGEHKPLLTDEEMDVLKSYGITSNDVQHLASMIYNRAGQEETQNQVLPETQSVFDRKDDEEFPMVMDYQEYLRGRRNINH